MLIGDGSYGINKTPILSNADDEINSFIKERYDTVVETEHITKDGRLYKETRIKGITKNLRSLGIYGQTKLNKRLPDDIFLASKEDVCDLIAGFYRWRIYMIYSILKSTIIFITYYSITFIDLINTY